MTQPHEDLADADLKDLEREELRLGMAVARGDIPPIWYRQRMAALAAQREAATRAEDDA